MYLMQNPDPTEILNPDDIRIRRVYTRPTGQLAPDAVIARLASNDIVVEWEAGSAANQYYGVGTGHNLELVVLVHSVNNWAFGGPGAVAIPGAAAVPGSPIPLNTDGENRAGTYQTEFVLGPPAAVLPWFPAAPHQVFEITAILRGPAQAGATPFQVAFAKCLCYVYP